MRILALSFLSLLCTAATEPAITLDVTIDQPRSARGLIHACMTRDQRHFPDCSKDPAALRQTIPAALRSCASPASRPGAMH